MAKNAALGTISRMGYRMAIRNLRSYFAAAGGLSAAINILMVTGSIYMLQVYDRVLSSGSVDTLLGLFAIVVIAFVFLGTYDFLRARILSRAALRLDQDLSRTAFWRSAMGEAEGSKPVADIETVRNAISGPAAAAVFDLPWAPIYFGILFLIHPWLGWTTLAGAGILAATTCLVRFLTAKSTTAVSEHQIAARNFAAAAEAEREPIVAMGMTGSMSRVWSAIHHRALAIQAKSGNLTQRAASFSKAFRLLLQSLILTIGAYLVLTGDLTAGMIIASSILSGRALAPIDQILGQWSMIGKALEAHRSLKNALPEMDAPDRLVDMPAPTGSVTITRGVKYAPGSLDGMRKTILRDIDLEVSPGTVLGVIGESGSGKSSMARIIAGIWSADAGSVRFDGARKEMWDPATFGRHVGYLPQVTALLPGTVFENIARFDPGIDDATVFAAARGAGVHDMILSLPEGYNTRVGRGGRGLSGGQTQRLALARAICGTPSLIVLDEPNSNLDAGGDSALADAIVTAKDRGATVVVVTHRPSLMPLVDRLVVLSEGRMVALGPRDEVLKATIKAQPDPGGTSPARPAASRPAARLATSER